MKGRSPFVRLPNAPFGNLASGRLTWQVALVLWRFNLLSPPPKKEKKRREVANPRRSDCEDCVTCSQVENHTQSMSCLLEVSSLHLEHRYC